MTSKWKLFVATLFSIVYSVAKIYEWTWSRIPGQNFALPTSLSSERPHKAPPEAFRTS